MRRRILGFITLNRTRLRQKLPESSLMLDPRFSDFQDVVTSREQIHKIIGEPMPAVLSKVVQSIDNVARQFIEQSPFLVLATCGGDGHLDLSPKGDPAGFVRILDSRRLAIPDRPGNRRVDSFHNLLENPRVGLMFIIPGKVETLRIRGEARIVRDPALRESMAVGQKIPEFALVVYVEELFLHCPKSMIRSGLWQAQKWPDSDHLPGIGEAMVIQGKLNVTPEELEAEAVSKGLLDLY